MASALASYIAQGYHVNDALDKAKYYVYEALKNADLTIGKGCNPLKHNFILKAS
jgi:hydroxymethylpyrimidine/phosphomethylpyrimidine kinase